MKQASSRQQTAKIAICKHTFYIAISIYYSYGTKPKFSHLHNRILKV